MDDNQIIELFFERKEKALSELSKKHGRLFQKIAGNVLRNEEDARECVNDAYLAAWNTIPPQKPNSLASFVGKIVRNIATTRYHHLSAEKRNGIYDVALDELIDCIPADEAADGDSAETLSAALNDFLETLSDDDRVMFVKRYWYSQSVSEIAEQFQATAHYISVRLFRTREKLRKFLEKRGILI